MISLVRIALSRFLAEPRSINVQPTPLHLRCMDAHMLGRLKLKAALLMRAMVNPNIQTGHSQMFVRVLLPRLANVAKLHWKGDLKNFSASHRDFVKKTLDRGIKMIMSRVDDPAAFEIAQEFGIKNFQGFLIDEMPESRLGGA